MQYSHEKYEWTKQYGTVIHTWSVVVAGGAVMFRASVFEDRVRCGLELCYAAPPQGRRNDPPDYLNCPLVGGRCWHTGTTLYAEETLWPTIQNLLGRNDHEAVFKILSHEARKRGLCTHPSPIPDDDDPLPMLALQCAMSKEPTQ